MKRTWIGNYSMMKLPSKSKAEALLNQAQSLNPGPWVTHSIYVAQAAEAIAACHPEMDPEAAYVLGYLHDIGRQEGVTSMRHAVDGYRFLAGLGYPFAARICLTHSYPIKNAAAGSSIWDGTDEEYQFVQTYLDQIEFTLYDRLIQLCDSLALPSGFCLLEMRLVDVVRRYGFNDLTIPKWDAFFMIKAEFDAAIGKSVYSVLPGIIENTFA